ncbi:MAG: alkene reductase [Pseudomonadota bacterium]
MTLKLLEPIQIGPLRLPNRVIMAPLTRCRAGEGDAPGEMNATYYRQRASAGLIISEAVVICPEGRGTAHTPGLYSEAQIAGWRKVTDAVHEAGGRIFAQLWHVGRMSHSDVQPGNVAPVAPSAVRPEGQARTYEGPKDYPEPRALDLSEIPGVVEAYAQAARNAKAAGFDGVELHAANGYLIDQFLQDGSNKRTDAYGGPIENRARLLFECLEAITEVWGPEGAGIRLSPSNIHGGISDSDPWALHEHVVRNLSGRGLAYLHVIEPRTLPGGRVREGEEPNAAPRLRPLFDGPYMAAGGFNRDGAEAILQAGQADMVAFGRWFISTPDLPERYARNLPPNPYDRATFYGRGPEGYTDYPFWSDSDASAAG